MLPCFERRRRTGFRVDIHDGAGEFRLRMQGPLAGEAVQEAEACWQTAASTILERRFIVDLRDVGAIDAGGHRLLERMSRAGARITLVAESPRRSWKDFLAGLACYLLRGRRGSTAA
ncbi:MAG: hypothetical protein KGN36_17005 [Acidobacteriota bacterium]|nr:hypothetical protein [Acidobacteriota bacterium]